MSNCENIRFKIKYSTSPVSAALWPSSWPAQRCPRWWCRKPRWQPAHHGNTWAQANGIVPTETKEVHVDLENTALKNDRFIKLPYSQQGTINHKCNVIRPRCAYQARCSAKTIFDRPWFPYLTQLQTWKLTKRGRFSEISREQSSCSIEIPIWMRELNVQYRHGFELPSGKNSSTLSILLRDFHKKVPSNCRSWQTKGKSKKVGQVPHKKGVKLLVFSNFETIFFPVRPCPISRTWLWCRRGRAFAWGRPRLWWTPGTRGIDPWQTAAPGTTSLPQTLRVRQAVGNDLICDFH